MWVIDRTASPSFEKKKQKQKQKKKKQKKKKTTNVKNIKMNIPANPCFFYIKWGVRGYTFHGHVFLHAIMTFVANNEGIMEAATKSLKPCPYAIFVSGSKKKKKKKKKTGCNSAPGCKLVSLICTSDFKDHYYIHIYIKSL